MDLDFYFTRFRANARVIEHLARDATEEQARWKPARGRWSILEVVHHLYDEERDDFRRRLDLLLHHPKEPWPPIDPEGWVVARKYNETNPQEMLERFLQEREHSLTWLAGLADPDWSSFSVGPGGQSLSAGDMLVSWLAHDSLHIRQLARLHYDYAADRSSPYDPSYAGGW